jgi:multidrug resistance efflux pump
MLEIIIGIYAGICWLIFKKFKLLPWNFISKVIVYSLPIFGTIFLILSLNYYCPITSDIRVINRSVDINPQILGRVKKVYVTTNQEVKKGDTLFTLDPEIYIQELKSLEARLKSSESNLASGNENLNAAYSNVSSLQSQLDLANKRVEQYTKLVAGGAANRFDLEQAQANANDLQNRLNSARSQAQGIQVNLAASYEGENAGLAELKAKIAQAKWNLEQTVVLAPADGTIPNVSINEGAILSAFKSAFVLIKKEQSVIGLFAQNELEAVQPGDEVELALRTEPGKIIKARLDFVIDATSQGLLNNAGGMLGGSVAGLPDTSRPYPEYEGKLAAKFIVDDPNTVLTTGARGDATLYSQHMKAMHIVRKVMIRINSKLNYIIPKLH